MWGNDPSVFEPALAVETLRKASALFGPHKYFRVDAEGFDRLPSPPVMLVANHSGGTTIPDVWGFMFAWYRHFGPSRPLHVLAHEMVMATNATGRYFARRGVLRASIENARRALQTRRDVLVMPGGDIDTWRPWTRRWKVEFAGRTGYARLALELGVSIVPVANAGAHKTFLVLTDGRAIARALGLQRIARAEVWPIHLSLPWGLAIGPWPHLPLPTTLHYRIGASIASERHPEVDEASDVRALDSRVRASVQALLDELSLIS